MPQTPGQRADFGQGVADVFERNEVEFDVGTRVRRDQEQEVVEIPGAIGSVTACTLLGDEAAKDESELEDGESGASELEEEDAPWLVGLERAEFTDCLELRRFGRFDSELFGFVVKGGVFEVQVVERPVEVLGKEDDQVVEGTDLGEPSGGDHDASLSSIQHRSTGLGASAGTPRFLS